MPGLNGTGPLGQGPLTGRGIGFLGNRLGKRLGLRRGFYTNTPQNFTRKEEQELLEDKAGYLKSELEAVNKRMEDLSKSDDNS